MRQFLGVLEGSLDRRIGIDDKGKWFLDRIDPFGADTLMIEPRLSPDEPRRLHALRETGMVHTPLEERFERITRLAQRLLGAPISAISLVESDYQWFKSIQGLDLTETSRAISFCGHAILGNDTMVIPDARTDPRFCDNPLVTDDPKIVFYAGHPIRGGDGSNIATLCVIDRKPRELGHDELMVLKDLAWLAEQELSVSMQSTAQRELLREIDSLSRRAKIDPLCRIWNREAIDELLEIFHSSAIQKGRGIGVILADIDRFKLVNDTFGHGAGDEVLRLAAKRMLGAIRESDELGRHGGEEFLIVLGRCESIAMGARIAERIRRSASEYPFQTEFESMNTSLSLGFAFAESASDVSLKNLLREADEAMYRAKAGGRNRVETSVLPAQGTQWRHAA